MEPDYKAIAEEGSDDPTTFNVKELRDGWKYDWAKIDGESIVGMTPRGLVKKYGLRGHIYNRKCLAMMAKLGEENPAKKEALEQAVAEVEAKLRDE